MKLRNRIFRTVVVGGTCVAAWSVGGALLNDVKFAHAEQQVQASREQIAGVEDLATVYKAVGKAVSPSVVNIDVHKTIKNPMRQMPGGGDEFFRRFFRNNGEAPDQNPAPQGDQDQQQDQGDEQSTPEMPDDLTESGTGSGVIVEVDGDYAYIITNNHVAGGATDMTITLSDGREIKDAELLGADPKSDLAVVKIKADHVIAAKWGDSNLLQQGDIVMAFGSPFGYVGSMTHGIVSALNRQAHIINGSFAYENFIQVDAPINPGNSGGPLVDLKGEIVGINTAIATRSGGFQGLGFAIPSDQAKYVYAALKDRGKVVRGWLGVGIQDVSKAIPEAEAQGYQNRTGVLVKQLIKNTPASGKLQPGDIITSLNGKKIETVDALRNQIASTAPGSDVTLNVYRDNKNQDVVVKLGEQPDDTRQAIAGGSKTPKQQPAPNSIDSVGLRLASPSDELTRRYNLDSSVSGAVVTRVVPNSPAMLAGLRPGDVITQINATKVESADDAKTALSEDAVKKGVKLLVSNGEGTRFVFLKSDK